MLFGRVNRRKDRSSCLFQPISCTQAHIVECDTVWASRDVICASIGDTTSWSKSLCLSQFTFLARSNMTTTAAIHLSIDVLSLISADPSVKLLSLTCSFFRRTTTVTESDMVQIAIYCDPVVDVLSRLSKKNFNRIVAACVRHTVIHDNLKALHCVLSKYDCEKSMLALITAARVGSLPAVKYLLERCSEFPVHSRVCVVDRAAKSGSVELVEWLLDNNFPLRGSTYISGAASGSRDMMEALMRRGGSFSGVSVVAAAARSGNLSLVQECVRGGCNPSEMACAGAVKSGNLDLLKWLRSIGCEWNEMTCYRAAADGRLDILKWCRSQQPPCPWSSSAFLGALVGSQVEILEWLFNNGCEPHYLYEEDSYTYSPQVMDWCIANGCYRRVNDDQ
jgi:hypothetical protein